VGDGVLEDHVTGDAELLGQPPEFFLALGVLAVAADDEEPEAPLGLGGGADEDIDPLERLDAADVEEDGLVRGEAQPPARARPGDRPEVVRIDAAGNLDGALGRYAVAIDQYPALPFAGADDAVGPLATSRSPAIRSSGSRSLRWERFFASPSVWNMMTCGTFQRAFSACPTQPESQWLYEVVGAALLLLEADHAAAELRR
jgi:hypothetical protein